MAGILFRRRSAQAKFQPEGGVIQRESSDDLKKMMIEVDPEIANRINGKNRPKKTFSFTAAEITSFNLNTSDADIQKHFKSMGGSRRSSALPVSEAEREFQMRLLESAAARAALADADDGTLVSFTKPRHMRQRSKSVSSPKHQKELRISDLVQLEALLQSENPCKSVVGSPAAADGTNSPTTGTSATATTLGDSENSIESCLIYRRRKSSLKIDVPVAESLKDILPPESSLKRNPGGILYMFKIVPRR